MKKYKKSTNTLIKRNNLVALLKKQGIPRVSKEAWNALEDILENSIRKLCLALREEMLIQGKRTLKKEEIQQALKKIKAEDFWEI